MRENSFSEIKQKLREFAETRDWDQFHTPKNLSMALAGEAGELLEQFQWLSEEQSYSISSEKREDVAMEIADILIYLVRLSDKLEIDPVESAYKKISINEKKYPADLVRGSAKKYTEY